MSGRTQDYVDQLGSGPSVSRTALISGERRGAHRMVQRDRERRSRRGRNSVPTLLESSHRQMRMLTRRQRV